MKRGNRGSDESPARAMPLRNALLAWAFSSLLTPGSAGEGLAVDALVMLAWLLVLFAGAGGSRRKVRSGAATIAGVCLLAVWTLGPRAYPGLAALFASMLGWGLVLGPDPRLDRRTVALALAPALLPLLLAAAAWVFGDEAGHALLQDEWRLPRLTFAWLTTAGRLQAAAIIGWLGLALASRAEPRRAPKRQLALIGATTVLIAACAARAATLISLATLPNDTQWSEPPLLLNLLKLRVGESFYGPVEDCNSYSYSPALEVVHHALLAPLQLDLSIVANRALACVWQLGTASLLAAIVLPFVTGAARSARGSQGGEESGEGAEERSVRRQVIVGAVLVGAVMLLVATSSILAANLHPDHLLMPIFALALGVALWGPRLSPRVLMAAFVLLPALATAVKLTGAGIGVGLVLAFVRRRPFEWRFAFALAAGAALAISALALSEYLYPGFWRYTFQLQASHPIRWAEWEAILAEPPGRVTLTALAALLASFAFGAGLDEARRDAGRIFLATLGFALPSFVAYLKVGGRVNSLLPLAIGSAVVLVRLAAALICTRREGSLLVGALGVWCSLTLMPPTQPVLGEARAFVMARHSLAVALIQRETSQGKRVLFFEGTAAWLDAGRRDVPRDRWQSVSELMLGRAPQVDAHTARLESGAYDTLVLGASAIDPRQGMASARLRAIVAMHYEEDEDTNASASRDEARPFFTVYRWVR